MDRLKITNKASLLGAVVFSFLFIVQSTGSSQNHGDTDLDALLTAQATKVESQPFDIEEEFKDFINCEGLPEVFRSKILQMPFGAFFNSVKGLSSMTMTFRDDASCHMGKCTFVFLTKRRQQPCQFSLAGKFSETLELGSSMAQSKPMAYSSKCEAYLNGICYSATEVEGK